MRRIPHFYGTVKVYKEFSSLSALPFHPVISSCWELSALASTFIDYFLQKLVPHIPIYVKNSQEDLQHLKGVNFTHHNIRITTSDTKSIYSNIKTSEGLQAVAECVRNSNMSTRAIVH